MLKMDTGETTPPCSFEDYVALCSLHRESDGAMVASIGQFSLASHADDPDLVLQHDGSYPKVAAGQPEVLPSVPVYGRVGTFVEAGSHKYALAYVFLWPYQEASTSGTDLSHSCSLKHVRVVVDRGTRKIERVFFPGTGLDGSGGWMQASALKFEDRARRRALVFVARGTHSLYPLPGFAWRVRGTISDTMDGEGQVWSHALVQALPGDVMAFTGRLAPAVASLREQPFVQVTVEPDLPGATQAMLTRIIPLRTGGAQHTSHSVGRSGHIIAKA